jgi:putative FmdB family regulatory protein
MPFYEYVCTNCGAATEILQKISDPPATTCPKCHAETLSKQISAAGFRLKGGGWYETDFKSGGQRNLVGSGTESAPAAAVQPATGSGNKDGAPAAKPAESKPADSKGGDSKASDSKPATTPTAAPTT